MKAGRFLACLVHLLLAGLIVSSCAGEETEVNPLLGGSRERTPPAEEVVLEESAAATSTASPTNTPTAGPTATASPTSAPTARPTATASLSTSTTRPAAMRTPTLPPTATRPPRSNCDPSYPDFCIPPAPPDLDCKHVAGRRFTVLLPDPHRFDRDNDGIGCES